jgi:hypothetical protein
MPAKDIRRLKAALGIRAIESEVAVANFAVVESDTGKSACAT